ERLTVALHHQDVVTVDAEMVAVLLMEKAKLAVRCRNADQHAVGGGQARQDRGVGLRVGRRRALVPPERRLVEHRGNHGAAANRPVTVRMHGDDDAVAKLDLLFLDRDDLTRQCWRRFEKAADITENRLRLINRAGEHESHASFAGREPVLHEQREEDRDRGGHAGLARAAAGDSPQLAHPTLGWGTVASHASEDLKLGLVERPAECGLQDRKPCPPRVDLAERGAKQAASGQGSVDCGHSSSSVASAARAASSASSWAMRSASDGPMSFWRLCKPSRLATRTMAETA